MVKSSRLNEEMFEFFEWYKNKKKEVYDYFKDYELEIELIQESLYFFMSFKDENGILRKTEVSYEVAKAMCVEFFRVERNMTRNDERHIDYWKNVEFKSSRKVYCQDLEMKLIDKMELEQAIQSLPELQKRRLLLYYFQRLTYKEIAEMENRDVRAIWESVLGAKKMLGIKIEKDMDEKNWI